VLVHPSNPVYTAFVLLMEARFMAGNGAHSISYRAPE
jgi:hypothetical protein